MLEASPGDIEVDGARYFVKGSPDKVKTLQEIAFATDLGFDLPADLEPYLDETAYQRHPELRVSRSDAQDRRGGGGRGDRRSWSATWQ